MKKLLSVLSLVCITAVFFTRCQQPHPSAEGSDSEGAKLFLKYCSRCHQDVGSGGPAPGGGLDAPDIRTGNKSAVELEEVINNGWGRMPSFKDSIPAADIPKIASYVANNIEYHVAKQGSSTGTDYLRDSVK